MHRLLTVMLVIHSDHHKCLRGLTVMHCINRNFTYILTNVKPMIQYVLNRRTELSVTINKQPIFCC